MNIRPMSRRDKPALMRLLRATPEFLPEEIPVAEEVLDTYLQEPSAGYYCLVGEEEAAVLGYVCYGPTPLTEGTWDIYWIAVTPEKKGQGIGKQLLQAAEEKIRAARGRLVLVETSGKPNYRDTRSFYLARGYREACRITDFYAPGDDLVTFRKDFPQKLKT